MKLHQRINFLSESFFRLKVVRSKPPPASISKNISKKKNAPINNIVIEFIGASGVGKSTVCNYFLNNAHLNGNGCTINHSDINQLVKNVPIGFGAEGIYDKLLLMMIEDIANKAFFLPEIKLSGIESFCLIKYFAEVLRNDFFISHYLNGEMVILDDGLCHNFSLQMLKLINDTELQSLLENKKFIYCTASLDFIFKNIKQRARMGKARPLVKGLNDDKLSIYINKGLRCKKNL